MERQALVDALKRAGDNRTLAARLLGNPDTRLYDGSWSEWGADPLTPKEKG